MPPKSKPGVKVKEPESRVAKTPQPPTPRTVNERSQQRVYLTNPITRRRDEVGVLGLSPAERTTWATAQLLPAVTSRTTHLSPKGEREFWKQVAKDSIPVRALKKDYGWGKDRTGRDIGEYTPEELQERLSKQATLTTLQLQHEQFLTRRDLARSGFNQPDGKPYQISDQDLQQERKRRRNMATLQQELYGIKMGPYASDPEWDDVVPIPADEPDGALAAIAYPDHYAEIMAYLRAVMASNECSPRCLRLTEDVISKNPAHYTVWLYRFKIISTLNLPIPDEIGWLNEVALEHLKNYQIWHHRQLLIDHYYPSIANDPQQIAQLSRSETKFLTTMLAEDTKNYHVWSYRQYLVRKLGMWNIAELLSTQNFIEEDVRNNSAWSHRFFLVFSDPAASTEGSHSTELDPKVPSGIVDREISYTKEKILLAPQNQAAWNYLRGVLVKGGRKLDTLLEFAEQFVVEVGDADKETVKSSHALDYLADAYAENGDSAKARLYLQRLAEKWDPIREGYWNYRQQLLGD